MVKANPGERLQGRVLRAESGRFLVDVGEFRVPCSLRGRVRKQRLGQVRNVVVGDRVLVQLTGSPPRPEAEGVIEERLPRESELSRASAERNPRQQVLMANLERVFVVMAAARPDFNARLLDRFLVTLAHQELDGVLVLNKCDLVEPSRLPSLTEPYRVAGYTVLATSALAGEGIAELAAAMRGRVSLFLGPSGVGKSSLLRAVQPGLELEVRTVSEATGKGRHATSATELHALDRGGWVADSPGVREFGLWGIEELELASCFPEFRPHLDHCHYPNCTHSHEPDCGLQSAVEAGRVDGDRYDSYLRILQSLREGRFSL